MFHFEPLPEPPSQALVSMVESPYGFSFVDFKIPCEDLRAFEELDIRERKSYDRFGGLEELKSETREFLNGIGSNSEELIEKLVARIYEITTQVLEASGKEMSWINLTASIPTDAFNMTRWHMDGVYYKLDKTQQNQYRFVVTLVGPSTLFYPLSKEFQALREVVWKNMNHREFMSQLCIEGPQITPKKGVGAVFIAGNRKNATLHSEPPIHEKRLFFSIVPCKKEDLNFVRQRVTGVYN